MDLLPMPFDIFKAANHIHNAEAFHFDLDTTMSFIDLIILCIDFSG